VGGSGVNTSTVAKLIDDCRS